MGTAKGRRGFISANLLIRAAADGDTQALQGLLSAGVDVNSANPGGQTALILAALMGRSETVSLLLEAGADVSLKDNHGLTASDWAQRRGFSEITELLTNTPPPEQRAVETKLTLPFAAGESQPEPSEREAALETESGLDEQTSEEERRKAVGFGPAAIAILKATTKPGQFETEPEHPSPEHEEAPIAVPASRTRPEEVGKSQNDPLPSVPKAQIRVEPPEPRHEDVGVADPASLKAHVGESAAGIRPDEIRPDETPRREADHIAPTAIRSEQSSGRVPAEGPVSASRKAASAEAGPRRLDKPARRETDRIAPATIRSEPLAPVIPAEPPKPASGKATSAESRPSIRPVETGRRETDPIAPTALQSERSPTGMQAGRQDRSPGEPHDAESALRLWRDGPYRLPADEAEPTAEALQSRMETERIFEEARKRVEKEVRRKAQYETRSIGETEPLRELGVTNEGKNVKRCPMCNTVYEDDTRTFCVYDSAPLISLEGPLSNVSSQTFGRPTLWALVAITLLGSIGVTYLVTSYVTKDKREAATAATLTEAPGEVEEKLPVVGGALVGKVVNLPNAEYPVQAKSEGIADAVVVVVRVNKNGRVISARALNGNRLLREAAVRAARKASFSPEKLASEEGIAAGTITYIFKP